MTTLLNTADVARIAQTLGMKSCFERLVAYLEADYLRWTQFDKTPRVAAHSPAGATKSVDALLADFAAAFKQQQLRALYQDYRTAVLQPGLTPAQRELLFNAAVAALDLTGLKDWQAVPE